MKRGFSLADKTVASGLVLPSRLRSGNRAAITTMNEEMSTLVTPTRKRAPWVDLSVTDRQARRNTAAATKARTTAITEKTSKGRGVGYKSMISGLVLPSRLRSGMRKVVASRSEEWKNSTFVIPLRKRTPARRDRLNRAVARKAVGAHTTPASRSEDSSRLGKTRKTTARGRVIRQAKGKGVDARMKTSKADKSVACGLVLPIRLRSGMRKVIASRSEEWKNSTFVIPLRKRTPARRDRLIRAVAREAVGAHTTPASRSEDSSRLGKTRKTTARGRVIRRKGVDARMKTSKADKSVACGLVLKSRLRSGMRKVTASRSEEWKNSTFVIPLRKRTQARRDRLNRAVAREAVGAHTTPASRSEDSSRLGKTRKTTARGRVIRRAKGKGVDARDSASRKMVISRAKGQGRKADKAVVAGVSFGTLRSRARDAVNSWSEESGKSSIMIPIKKKTPRLVKNVDARAAVGACTTPASRSEDSSRLGKTDRERVIRRAKGKGVEARDSAAAREREGSKGDKAVVASVSLSGTFRSRVREAVNSRSEKWGKSSILIPIKKRTPRFLVSAEDTHKRADSRTDADASTSVVVSGSECDKPIWMTSGGKGKGMGVRARKASSLFDETRPTPRERASVTDAMGEGASDLALRYKTIAHDLLKDLEDSD